MGSGVARARARLLPTWFPRAIVLVGLLSLGCGDDEELDEQVAQISGTVRDEASGARLKGARVLFTADTLETAEARTNEDGEYDLTVAARAPNGRIEASKKGYQGTTVSVFLDDNTVQIDVDLPLAD